MYVLKENIGIEFLQYLRAKCGIENPISPPYYTAEKEVEYMIVSTAVARLIRDCKADSDELLASFLGPMSSSTVMPEKEWKVFSNALKKKKLLATKKAIEDGVQAQTQSK